MDDLFESIRHAVQKNRYLFSLHADDMLRERGIVHWQIIHGIDSGHLIVARRDAQPNPIAEIEQILADGTPVKAVWAYIHELDMAKLVTVHFFDR